MLRERISSYGMHAGSLESSKEATIAYSVLSRLPKCTTKPRKSLSY